VSIGKTLTAARTKAGMSVEQVSEATRVRQTLVRQIEADDHSQCGGDFYARGHIRNIAHAVGLDPAPLLAEFDQQHSAGQAARAAQVFEPETVRAERRGPNWSAAMAVALGVVCIWGLVQVFTSLQDDTPRTSEQLAGETPVPGPGTGAPTPPKPAPPAPPVTTTPPDAVAAVPRDAVTVRVIGIQGSSWVRATNKDGKQLFESIVKKGQTQDFTDKQQVRLVVGNAGAVRLIVNGKDLGTPGDKGQVIRLRFGPGDPQAAG
jgi:cytoskeleton protein RodZ